jgi:hypothetical protein
MLRSGSYRRVLWHSSYQICTPPLNVRLFERRFWPVSAHPFRICLARDRFAPGLFVGCSRVQRHGTDGASPFLR